MDVEDIDVDDEVNGVDDDVVGVVVEAEVE
jgi:hypothetical protein